MAATKKKAVKKKTVKKSTVKKTAVKKKVITKKAVSKKTATTKKATAKKKAVKKRIVKKTVVKKTVAKKTVAKKTTAKKVVVKKTVVKKTATKKHAKPKATTIKKTTPVTKKKSIVTTSKLNKTTPAKKPSAPTTTQGGFDPYMKKKGEEYMNESQTAHFNKILNAWKKELMEEVDRTVHHMQDEAANFPDPNDRASQESEFALELRARDRERKLIKKIDEAINNLDNEDYGYCNICGIEIGIRRLEARPTASLCIDCKTLDEIREKQVRG